MSSVVIYVLVGLCIIFDLASSAPPFIAPNSLALLRTNLTLPHRRNTTLGYAHEFPPEADLPDPDKEGFYYPIPDTDLIIEFQEWGHETPPPSEARNVLRFATGSCLKHDRDVMMGPGSHHWEYGRTFLDVYPETSYTGEVKPLTWGAMMHVIAGFSLWLRAYPGMYFGFEIFEAIETEAKEITYVSGYGQLSVYLSGGLVHKRA